MKKVYIYKGFERFWHWTQAILIFLLAVTGFEIHDSITIFGFELAVTIHNAAAISFIVLIVFTIFWHFTTGEWRQYIPTTKNLKAQFAYYISGIFRNAPHPTRKTQLSKLNPLQRLVYLGLKVIFIPLMVISGIIYMFFRYPVAGEVESLGLSSVTPIAVLHTIGAFILLAFVIVHLYLITTGQTITSNLKAMLTGWEELEEEENNPKKEENNKTNE